MPRREMTQGAHGRLGDVLPVAGLHDGADETLDTAHLADEDLVARVVAGEIGEDAAGAGDHVDVVGGEELDEHLQETLGVVLL